MLIISAKEQREIMDMGEVMDSVELSLKEYSAQRTDTPIRTSLPFGEDNVGLVMPSLSEELETMGFKYVTVVPENANKGKKVIHGVVLLSDTTTGEPLALLEGSYLTMIKTGAMSGVATRYLASENASTMGIIGTGEQAKGLCEAVFTARDIKTVYMYNRTVEKAEKFASDIREQFGKEVIVCKDANEVVRNSEVLVTATTTIEPLYDEPLRPGMHVNAVGSFKPNMQEIPTDSVTAADKVVVESVEAALAETGDLQIPIKEGVFSEEQIYGELGEIVSGDKTGRESEDEITLFNSVGLAIADIVVAKYLYDKAVEKNAGVQVDI